MKHLSRFFRLDAVMEGGAVALSNAAIFHQTHK